VTAFAPPHYRYPFSIDWSVFHALNGLMSAGDGAQDTVEVFASLSVPAFAVATVLLWLGDRPGGPLRWRLASASALFAGGLGLLVNQAIGQLWFRERPFTAHPGHTVLLTSPSPDPSFPSDHATAAFAIAFAVFFFSRSAGSIFLAGALAIGLSRIFLGVHYPGDVAAGAAIGLASAAVVVYLARPAIVTLVSLASRLTNPLVRPLWRVLSRLGREARAPLPPGRG
jgi:undecaprenyl-diphosphatase